ncbi:MAG: hypothetical protein PHQ27_03460 [Victivallales bacterium]|nr:hypothetical protein [Victivallales bacterium]
MMTKSSGGGDKEMKFGFSLAYGPELSLPELGQLPLWPGRYGEVSGRLMEMKKAMALLLRRRRGWIGFNAAEIISSGVSRSIAGQNDSIISDFKRELFRLLGAMRQRPECVIVDLGVEEARHDPAFRRALLRMLHGMAMDLYLNQVTLALPVRVPGGEDGFDVFCLELRNQLMNRQLGFSIDIHPHEMTEKLCDPAGQLRWLKFDLAAIRFFYEPETGNHLVARAVAPWLRFLATTPFAGQVTFCPRCATVEIMGHEMTAIRELLSRLPAESE